MPLGDVFGGAVRPAALVAAIAVTFSCSNAFAIIVGDPLRSFDPPSGPGYTVMLDGTLRLVSRREPCIDPETGLPIPTLPEMPPPPEPEPPPVSRTVPYYGTPMVSGDTTGLLRNPRCYGPDAERRPCTAPPAVWFHRWPEEADIARHSVYNCLWQQNQAAIQLFIREREQYPNQQVWVGTVPGMSYGSGGHGTPCPEDYSQPCVVPSPPNNISEPFKERLRNSYRLLRSGAVRFLNLSGGMPDPRRPEYIEAKEALLWIKWAIENNVDGFEGGWPGPETIDSRFFIDPIAEHSTTNIGNADRLYAQLGMSRSLVVTDMVPCAHDPMQHCGIADDVMSMGQQAYYFEGDVARSIYGKNFKKDMGFEPGSFHYQGVLIRHREAPRPPGSLPASVLPFVGRRQPRFETVHSLMHFPNYDALDQNLWQIPLRGLPAAPTTGVHCPRVRTHGIDGSTLPQL